MKLSIIIPVYNCEKYISRCLDSVLKIDGSIQWECIIVDDGSKDGTGKIIEEYSTLDSRFKVFHKENSGVSDARNMGIKVASGGALFFIDADDWFFDTVSRQLQEGLERLENGTSTVFGHNYMYANGTVKKYDFPNVQGLSYLEKLRKLTVLNQKLNTCWGMLFKKDIILKYNILFDKNMKIAEDSCFVLDYLIYECDIYVDHEPIIAYWQDENSAIHRIGSETILDDERCFIKRKQMIQLLGINISDTDYSQMCNFYFSNTIGYLAVACSNCSLSLGIQEVKKFVKSPYGQELIYKCEKNSLSKTKRLLVDAFRLNLYLVCYVLMIVYVRNRVQ